MPVDGSTTRTYNVNGELVQYSDSEDATKNRYFANDAQGNAVTVIQGNFDGKDGRLNVSEAFDHAIARTGNQVKAQYFFAVNGQAVGNFGQLTCADGSLKANFDVNGVLKTCVAFERSISRRVPMACLSSPERHRGCRCLSRLAHDGRQ